MITAQLTLTPRQWQSLLETLQSEERRLLPYTEPIRRRPGATFEDGQAAEKLRRTFEQDLADVRATIAAVEATGLLAEEVED